MLPQNTRLRAVLWYVVAFIMGLPDKSLSQGVTEEKEKCEKIECFHCMLLLAQSLTRRRSPAAPPVPVLSGKDKGLEPEVGEDKMQRHKMTPIGLDERENHGDKIDGKGYDSDDFLVDNVDSAVGILIHEVR